MNTRIVLFLACLILLLCLAGCGPPAGAPAATAPAEATEPPLPTATAPIAPTMLPPAPTRTSEPTAPPAPTWTPTTITPPTMAPTAAQPVPTSTPLAGPAGWSKFAGSGVELWLPASFVGGDPAQTLDFVIDAISRRGEMCRQLATLYEQNREEFLTRAIVAADCDASGGVDGSATMVNVESVELKAGTTVTTMLASLADQSKQQGAQVALDITHLAGYETQHLEIIQGEIVDSIYFIVTPRFNWAIRFVSTLNQVDKNRPIFDQSAQTFVLQPAGSVPIPTPTFQAPTQEKRNHWRASISTKGARLIVNEIQASNDQQEAFNARFSIRAGGFPDDQPLVLWVWLITLDHPTPIGTFLVDKTGFLHWQTSGDLYEGLLVHNYLPAEVIPIALMTLDQSQRAYDRASPLPLGGSSPQGCAVEIELLTPDGLTFAVSGQGFQPGETLKVSADDMDEVLESSEVVKEDGTYESILMPGTAGFPMGLVTYTVTGRACEVSVAFPYGSMGMPP